MNATPNSSIDYIRLGIVSFTAKFLSSYYSAFPVSLRIAETTVEKEISKSFYLKASMAPSGKVPDAWDDDWVTKADVSSRI